jgi:hypothetical protein
MELFVAFTTLRLSGKKTRPASGLEEIQGLRWFSA